VPQRLIGGLSATEIPFCTRLRYHQGSRQSEYNGGDARRPLPASFTVRDGLLDGVHVEGRLAAADDHVPGRRGGQEFRRLVRPAGRCETAIQPVLLRPETTQNRWPAGSVKSLKPVSRSFTGTGVAPRASRFLLGPAGIAGADVPVHLPRIGGIGPLRPNAGGYALESQPALAGPEPMPAQLVDRPGLSGSASAGR
jgi:hypothetical protein